MTTFSEACEAIRSLFVADWGSTTPLTLENEDFTPPDEPWVRLSIRHRGAPQETLGKVGNRRFARIGSVFVQVYTPSDDGRSQNEALTEQAAAVFEGKSISGTTVRFNDVVVRETGVSDDFYQVVVEANFEYDERK